VNILDMISEILSMFQLPPVKMGFIPATPDECIALFEYKAVPPEHSFGGTDYIHGVQVRSRSLDAEQAHANAYICEQALNLYHDGILSITQSTPILDIGCDSENPARKEYTVNFTVRRL